MKLKRKISKNKPYEHWCRNIWNGGGFSFNLYKTLSNICYFV